MDLLVNGKADNVETATIKEVNERQTTIIPLDEDKLGHRLEEQGDHAVITIPILIGSDVAIGELNGRLVNNMNA